MNRRPQTALSLFLTIVCSGSMVCGRAGEALPPLRDPGTLSFPAPTQRVKIKPELVGVHPRLIFNTAGLEAVREKLKKPAMASIQAGFLSQAKRWVKQGPPTNPPNTEDPFRGFGTTLSSLAMAYLITDDPVYLEAEKKWMQAVTRYPSWAGDEDLGASHICFGMALAYDWLYAQWTPEERQEIEASLHGHAKILLFREVGPKYRNGFWGQGYFNNHFWINNSGIAAAAAALYDLNPAEYQPWLDQTRSAFQFTYQYLGVDGSYHEGPAYARYGGTWLLRYIDLLRSVSGEDLSDMKQLQGFVDYFCYLMMPDWKSIANYGDSPETGWGPIDNELLAGLGAHFQDGHAEWLRQKTRAAFKTTHYESAFDLLWQDPHLEAKPLDDLPLMRLFPDLGLVIFRTGWQENAAVLTFKCGPPGGHSLMEQCGMRPIPAYGLGHSHPDANSFLFWAGQNWRIGAPAGYTHAKWTRNENVWTVDGKGQFSEGQEWPDAKPFVGKSSQAHLIGLASTPATDYAEGEAAPAYTPSSGLTQFRRRLLLVKSGEPYLVVYDTLTASTPRTFNSYLHSALPISVQGTNRFGLDGDGPGAGQVFGPDGLSLNSGPLSVLDDKKKTVQRGFELSLTCPQPTNAFWVVTVLGNEKNKPHLLTSDPAPSLQVGDDKINWSADGQVSVNGKALKLDWFHSSK